MAECVRVLPRAARHPPHRSMRPRSRASTQRCTLRALSPRALAAQQPPSAVQPTAAAALAPALQLTAPPQAVPACCSRRGVGGGGCSGPMQAMQHPAATAAVAAAVRQLQNRVLRTPARRGCSTGSRASPPLQPARPPQHWAMRWRAAAAALPPPPPPPTLAGTPHPQHPCAASRGVAPAQQHPPSTPPLRTPCASCWCGCRHQGATPATRWQRCTAACALAQGRWMWASSLDPAGAMAAAAGLALGAPPLPLQPP